jgi:uncharacterized protein YjbI with pentapeptide repeats
VDVHVKNNIQKSEPMVKPPKLVKRKLVEGLPGGSIVAREQYRSLLLSAMNLSNQIATHASFEEMLFTQVNMANTQLEELRLEDVRLSECDLMTANWYKAGFYRTELIGCRMTGFLAGEAHFQDVLFKDCQINLAQFRFSTFTSVRFEHCDLGEADFLEANFSHVVLIDCNLRNAELSGSKLGGVDFSTCNLDGARVGIQELRGATIDLKQAISLVEALGINVKFQGE